MDSESRSSAHSRGEGARDGSQVELEAEGSADKRDQRTGEPLDSDRKLDVGTRWLEEQRTKPCLLGFPSAPRP